MNKFTPGKLKFTFNTGTCALIDKLREAFPDRSLWRGRLNFFKKNFCTLSRKHTSRYLRPFWGTILNSIFICVKILTVCTLCQCQCLLIKTFRQWKVFFTSSPLDIHYTISSQPTYNMVSLSSAQNALWHILLSKLAQKPRERKMYQISQNGSACYQEAIFYVVRKRHSMLSTNLNEVVICNLCEHLLLKQCFAVLISSSQYFQSTKN